MPWSVGDVDRHRKGLSDKQKETWVEVANGALERCLAKEGSDEAECEGSAIRQANSLFEEAQTKTVDGEDFSVSEELEPLTENFWKEWDEDIQRANQSMNSS